MENTFKIEPTKNTPGVFINYESGVIQIYGRSFRENSSEFYEKIYEEIKKIKTNNLDFHFALEYINSAATKNLFSVLQKCKATNIIDISWHHEIEDYDMLNLGSEFLETLNVPFYFTSEELKPEL